jgi:hypothetical protein
MNSRKILEIYMHEFFYNFAVNCLAYMTFSAVFKNNVFKYVLHSSGKQP